MGGSWNGPGLKTFTANTSNETKSNHNPQTDRRPETGEGGGAGRGSADAHTHTEELKGVEKVNTRAGEGTFPLGLVTMLFLVLFVWGCAGKESEKTQKHC